MNKEQKSFWEYGAAWATTVVIHTYIRSLLKDRGIQAFNNLPDYWMKGDFE